MILLFAITALAQQPPADPPKQQDEATQDPPLPAVPIAQPPQVRATLFARMGTGAARTRMVLNWQIDKDQPLDNVVIDSWGIASNMSVTGWFHPFQGKGFLLIAELSGGTGSSIIHFSGKDSELIDQKKVEYGTLNLLAGIGYRQWFGSKKRYSVSYFGQIGPGVASLTAENVFEDVKLIGGEFLLGASLQYHYSTRIVFGGLLDFGYRGYYGPDHEADNPWTDSGDEVDVELSSGYFRLQAILGYDF